MNWRRIIIGVVIVVVLVGGGFWAYQQFLAPEPEPEETVTDVNTLLVDTGVEVVSAEGQIVPLQYAILSFQMGGEVTEILVEEGESVEADEPLVRLKATELEAAVSQAEAALAREEANLQAAQAQFESAQSRVTSAELGVSAAEAQLALLQSDPLPEEIAAAENNVAAAAAGISQATGNRDATLEIPASQIRAAEAEVAAAMAEVDSLQDTYDDIIDACFETPDGEEICPLYGPVEEQTRFQLETAQTRLDAAQTKVDELNAGATAGQRRAANAGVGIAAAQRDAAQAQLNLLLASPTAEQVQEAEARVQQAQASLTQAEAAVTQAETAVTQAHAGVSQAQASLEAAQIALDRMTLKAPFSGTVAALNLELGEIVAPGTPVGSIANFSKWLVETTDLTELDVVAVTVGQPVEVSVDAIPGERISGTITDIATVSSLTRGDVTYPVTIELEDTADLPLRWGMTVFVDVDVEE